MALFHRKTKPKPDNQTIGEYYAKKVKKQQRVRTIKNVLLSAFIILGVLCGYLALFRGSQSDAELLLLQNTFVQDYLEAYFSYPNDPNFIQTYSLDKWRVTYQNSITAATVTDVIVYKTDRIDSKEYDVYARVEQTIAHDDQQENLSLSVKVRVAQDKEGILVVQSPQMVSTPVDPITDPLPYSMEWEIGSTPLTSKESSEVSNTLSLFLQTFSSNIDQAALLTDVVLSEQPDPDSVYSLDSITRSGKDEEYYYCVARVIVTTHNIYTQQKEYYFVISIERNKIIKMEVK